MTLPASHVLNLQMRRVLYALKRTFGGAILIYQNQTVTTDTTTGEVTRTATSTSIRRAIVLPVTLTREVKQSISLISANKQLVTGGSFEKGKRLFIIDRRDCPTLVLSMSDWVAYGGRKYTIENFDEYEFDTAYVIVGKELTGQSTGELVVGAQTELSLTSDADAEG